LPQPMWRSHGRVLDRHRGPSGRNEARDPDARRDWCDLLGASL